jgi:hypothetical protein
LVHRRDEHVVDVNQNRHGEHVVRELVLHRCTCAVRGLDVRLRNDRETHVCLMAFPHPCVVACRKDSKHHYFAWRPELQRAEIQRGYGHLGRVAHEEHEIRPLPPWYLAWRASWQQLFLLRHGEQNQLLAWFRYRGRGLDLAFGRAAFS